MPNNQKLHTKVRISIWFPHVFRRRKVDENLPEELLYLAMMCPVRPDGRELPLWNTDNIFSTLFVGSEGKHHTQIRISAVTRASMGSRYRKWHLICRKQPMYKGTKMLYFITLGGLNLCFQYQCRLSYFLRNLVQSTSLISTELSELCKISNFTMGESLGCSPSIWQYIKAKCGLWY